MKTNTTVVIIHEKFPRASEAGLKIDNKSSDASTWRVVDGRGSIEIRQRIAVAIKRK